MLKKKRTGIKSKQETKQTRDKKVATLMYESVTRSVGRQIGEISTKIQGGPKVLSHQHNINCWQENGVHTNLLNVWKRQWQWINWMQYMCFLLLYYLFLYCSHYFFVGWLTRLPDHHVQLSWTGSGGSVFCCYYIANWSPHCEKWLI